MLDGNDSIDERVEQAWRKAHEILAKIRKLEEAVSPNRCVYVQALPGIEAIRE